MTKTSNIAGRAPGLRQLDLRVWVPLLFLVLMFLLGGSSRSDIASAPLLRGASVLFGCWAIVGMHRQDWRRIRTPLILLLALTLWNAVQLIPLAPSLWHSLPGRETIVAIDRLLGQADLWRPISLTPAETWNSLLAMTVPLAAVLLAGRLDRDDIPRVLQALVAIAVASALLGLVQILAGGDGPAVLYRIANTNSMIGLFANRNHHAIFQACAILFAAMLLRDELMRRKPNIPMQFGLVFALLLSTAMTMLVGSRAGLGAGVVAFAAAYAMLWPTWRSRPAQGGRSAPGQSRYSQLLAYAPLAVFAALLVAVFFLAERTTSLSRVADNRVAEDLRVLAWPTMQHMVETYWVAGAGFGSFPDAYKIFEPDALLQPAYFNHAHNDWVEVPITGGLPFALILLAALVWFARAALRRGVKNLIKGHRGDDRLPILLTVGLLGAASIVDYPLRVPSLQAMTVILIALFACPKRATARRE